jgi:hypothetical protein
VECRVGYGRVGQGQFRVGWNMMIRNVIGCGRLIRNVV